MDRRPNSFGPVLGYHGCDRAVAEKALSGNTDLKPSENSYDWLGSGIRQYTHIQIAVRTPEIITGYFRVKGFKKPKS